MFNRKTNAKPESAIDSSVPLNRKKREKNQKAATMKVKGKTKM